MEQIAPGAYVSTFYPGINAGFVVTDKGVVAIDAPPLPADAHTWRERITEIAGGPIRYVVLTDDHPDRLLGVGWMEAPVVAGRGTLRRLQENGDAYWRAAVEEWERRRPEAKGLDQARLVLPEVVVAGRITLHGSPPVIAETVAGAAPGSVWVMLAGQEILFAGDTVVVNRHPPLATAPDTRAWLKTLVELRRARFPVKHIVPGRGPVSKKDATRGLSEYIQRARRRIRSLHAAASPRGDLVELVAEFLSLLPVEEEEQEWVRRQVRDGLEHLYEQLRPEAPEQ
jgi:glyoxylase-like metal-dependent hydrolase (beta-lactamase superfamily II)